MTARKRSKGQSLTWLCAGSLAFSLLLVFGLIALLARHGLAAFWQTGLVAVETADGQQWLGEIWDREAIPGEFVDGEPVMRIRMKSGNRDLDRDDFRWLREADLVRRETPEDAVLLERLEDGVFHGYLQRIVSGDQVLAEGPDQSWTELVRLLEEKEDLRDDIHHLQSRTIDDINRELEDLRLRRRNVAGQGAAERLAEIDAEIAGYQAEYEVRAAELAALRETLEREVLIATTQDGRELRLPVGHVVRPVRPNQMDTGDRFATWCSRVAEFLFDEPRESNTAGGILPALFGTVLMVFLMSFAVVPLGVLAAVYLHEYAGGGIFVRAVRIAVNNLAGVPSIVFGVFGLGFFVYGIGGTIDEWFFSERLPRATYGTGGILWASLTLALLTVPVVVVATEEGLAAVPRAVREGSLALGATRWETLSRVVLPASAPGILTGVILAISRAAGEVAPLMIVGMVKMASLPIDHHPPYLHLSGKFMHLGFHVFDLAFQAPSIEAVRPLVFATAFLLVMLVVVMNLVATTLRSHLTRKYTRASV